MFAVRFMSAADLSVGHTTAISIVATKVDVMNTIRIGDQMKMIISLNVIFYQAWIHSKQSNYTSPHPQRVRYHHRAIVISHNF